jgi:hypothetical protein
VNEKKMHTVEITNDPVGFDKECNKYLREGWHLGSCNCGVASDNAGTSDTFYQAIFYKHNWNNPRGKFAHLANQNNLEIDWSEYDHPFSGDSIGQD